MAIAALLRRSAGAAQASPRETGRVGQWAGEWGVAKWDILGKARKPLLKIDWDSLLLPHIPLLQSLDAPFSIFEVHEVIKHSKNYKAPGPNGLPLEFFKAFWSPIRGSLVDILNDLLLHPKDLCRINLAYITLIPKKEGVCRTRDFRPIILENSLIKKISKLLAKRLAPFMSSLIDNKQGAFSKGHNTLDCFMMISEILWACHLMDKDLCIIKFDFKHAFDSISWDFISDMMTARGFPPKWISWISNLLNSSSSAVLINGSASRTFSHKRGLRQGNLISPLIFNLVADTLSRLISRAVQRDLVQGVLKDYLPEAISHVLFADDLIMICKADAACFEHIKLLLNASRCHLVCGLTLIKRVSFHLMVTLKLLPPWLLFSRAAWVAFR
ncbi:hypothetical protein Cni_G19909 [Canna indica]|uniref:Reverse transcriptase domain-containing protein n=1 Tax=Canna indica TaxID=4628 RepID=A0AAQ3KLF4_9LILI|nr:hypothetical protein Cni_G19909 [Canna indica]